MRREPLVRFCERAAVRSHRATHRGFPLTRGTSRLSAPGHHDPPFAAKIGPNGQYDLPLMGQDILAPARVPNRGSSPAVLLRESFREGGKVKTRTLANPSPWPGCGAATGPQG